MAWWSAARAPPSGAKRIAAPIVIAPNPLFSVGIGSDHVFTLFFAGLVWLMAAVIAQGQTLAEENEGFV